MKKEHNKELEKLIKLVRNYMNDVEEEMEHGCYETPECVPYKFEDEGDDYYKNHDVITDKVRNDYTKIVRFIDKYENGF